MSVIRLWNRMAYKQSCCRPSPLVLLRVLSTINMAVIVHVFSSAPLRAAAEVCCC